MAEQMYSATDYSSPRVRDRMGARTATLFAAFLLPHLKSGMTLLDAGCGPGSITLGLAAAVSPGQVVGIDIEPSHIESATALAEEQGVTNVRFAVGDVYKLDFPDARFDAVYSNAVVNQVGEPLRALKEFRRVLKPGGVIGVRDYDPSTIVMEPSTPVLEAAIALYIRHLASYGSPFYSRQLRALMLQAGFDAAEGIAITESWGKGDTVPLFVNTLESILRAPALHQAVLERDWVTHAQLEMLAGAVGTWGERPDAFASITAFAGLGFVGMR
jgi:ubiquinone/menaquinone biosynthesis C-methylase UbiE